jgi:hypothetical protein
MVERGIELEFLEGGCLTSVLKGLQYDDENLEKRLLWVSQCVEAIRHAHSKNIHCYDVSSNNFVLDGQKNVKAIDFEDAEIMGEIPLTDFCHAGHSCPPFNEKIRRDIFLLGVIIYQVMTGSLPYQYDDQPTWKQIERRYEKGEFSSTSSLPGIGDIIAQCWEGRYQCVEEIETDIKHEKGTTSQTWKLYATDTFSAGCKRRQSHFSLHILQSEHAAMVIARLLAGIILVWSYVKRKR